MSLIRTVLMVWLLFAVTGRPVCAEAAADVDVLLQGGTIIDGTGGEPYEGSVAVRDGKIVAVGEVAVESARRVVDCRGLVICPGFIDLHNHSDNPILAAETRDARCYLTQGCTTLVTGNCGGGHHEVGAFYDRLDAEGSGANVAHLLPHGALRDHVMGQVRRPPTDEELQQMRDLTDAAMREGAWGMTTGLIYVPSAYAGIDELVEIARVVGKHGGIYASHIRDEGDRLIESIEEAIEIGRRAGVAVHISHLKANGRRNWGKVRVAARVIEQARDEGLEVTADQYPYNASSTSMMAMLLPNHEREGGARQTADRLKDPEEVARLRPVIAQSLQLRDRLMIAGFRSNPEWVGKMIRDVAAEEGRDQVDIALELLRGRARGVNFGMDEADVRYMMTYPWVATASDGSSKIDDGTRPHPRSYGTFPRKIGRYAIQENVLSLPAAVRSASGLPADILGMSDRGYVREGLVADLVVFDPEELEDRATYERPFEHSAGVRWVLVGGEIVIDDGMWQDTLAGRPLRRNVEPSGSAD